MGIPKTHNLINTDLEAVENLILNSLKSKVDLTETIGNYVVKSGGKRLRAVLTLLSAKALSYQGHKHHLLAAIIEIIHTATLLHDDVVDASELRRGQPSANAIYGNMASVLCGDFLYSKAFELMIGLEQLEILAALAHTSNIVAEGEMLQLKSCHNPEFTEAEYFEVISQKTAALFETACSTPCLLDSAYLPYQAALKNYGKNIGLAFQIIDDLLDYTSASTVLGKNPGDDLSEGKLTLPLIYALKHSKPEAQELLRDAIKTGDLSQFAKIKLLIDASGALKYTQAKALELAQNAATSLKILPDSLFKTALIELAETTVARSA